MVYSKADNSDTFRVISLFVLGIFAISNEAFSQ
jgi:hypothetical protein